MPTIVGTLAADYEQAAAPVPGRERQRVLVMSGTTVRIVAGCCELVEDKAPCGAHAR